MAGVEQLDDYLTNPKIKQEHTELCKLAIDDFNSKNVSACLVPSFRLKRLYQSYLQIVMDDLRLYSIYLG